MSENRESHFFYGYIVVLAAICIMLVADGIFYSFGVFFEPVLTEFGWTRTSVSGAYSLCMILIALLSIGIGGLNDRFGPRILLTGCGFFLGLGYLLISQIGAVWQLYLFFGVLIAIGESSFLVPLLSTVARWFVKRRGLMAGIASTGISLGIIIVPPLASRLISTYGWRTSYIIVGIIALVLIIPAAQFLKRDPSQIGLSPYGENESKEENLNLQDIGFTLRQAMHTRQLWLLCTISFCGYYATSVIMVHVVIHATGLGITALSAANILAIIGGGSLAGRIIMGIVADRVGSKLALISCFILMSIALAWLMVIKELWMFYLFAAIFGISFGGMSPLRSPVTAELFGLKAHGVILGLAYFSDCIGGVIGPVLAGWIFDMTGSYQWAFLICLALSIVGIMLSSMLRPTKELSLSLTA
ncbi:MFS transporter [Chloroflexota bacterium]